MTSKRNKQCEIVTIGGGTGTFAVLSGLKKHPHISLTAVVSSADDGGATGRLRDAYGSIPMGDFRQALVALSECENGDNSTLMRDLCMFRFAKGDVSGHNFGNLFLTALREMLGSDIAALEAASRLLRLRGTIVPSSEVPIRIVAMLENGEQLVGEHAIDERIPDRPRITSLSVKETHATLYPKAAQAIRKADMIILGPADLYTSMAANLVVPGCREAVRDSKATLVYVLNLFTTAGQTLGFSASDFVSEVTRYAGRKPDIVVVHTGNFPEDVLSHYRTQHEHPVADDLANECAVIRGAFARSDAVQQVPGDTLHRSLIRHDSDALADCIVNQCIPCADVTQ